MFRVSVRGKFTDLTEAQRTELQSRTDLSAPSFTEAGTFTSDTSMAVFTFRIAIPAADDDDAVATELALDALRRHGYPVQVMKVAVTDLREIKINRKGR